MIPDKSMDNESPKSKNQFARHNEWIKKHYERISITFPKRTKDMIRAITDESMNAYLNRLVAEDLRRH